MCYNMQLAIRTGDGETLREKVTGTNIGRGERARKIAGSNGFRIYMTDGEYI